MGREILRDQQELEPGEANQKSPTAVQWVHVISVLTVLPSRIFENVLRSTSSWSLSSHFQQDLGGAERHAMIMMALPCLAWLSARSHGMTSAEK